MLRQVGIRADFKFIIDRKVIAGNVRYSSL